ncbi:MAG: adenylate/guanylate cyclase domain-containing protein [bacterium]
MLESPTPIRQKIPFVGVVFAMVVAFALVSCNRTSTNYPRAEKGILDAEHLFARQHTPLYLDGEWEFYPNELIFPEEFHNRTMELTMPSPSFWLQDLTEEQVDYATYRLRMVNHDLPPVFSIRNHQIFSAFRLFVNGKEVLSNGVVATTKEKEQPSYHPKTVSIISEADTLEFVLHVSNHNYRKGGIGESFIVGQVSSLLRNNMVRTGFDFFLAGSLLIMAIYYLVLFFVLRKEKSSLFFSVFIGISIIRLLVTGQRLLLLIFPGISWESMLRLEYGSFYLAPVFLILFFNAVFREEVKIYLVNLVMGFSGLFTLLVLVTPVSFFSATLPVYQIYVVVLSLVLVYQINKARKKGKEGALVLLLGIGILFVTLLHDMIYAYGSFRGSEIFPAGLVFFILCQSYVLFIQFSLINKENQELWDELDYRNQNLEQMVKARTRELVKQKKMLEKTNLELEKQKETMVNQGQTLEFINELLEKEKEKSDQLLLNVLPQHIAEELRVYGRSLAHSYPHVSVLFVDFVKFSELSETIPPADLLKELHFYFASFDDIAKKYNLEKIKTIGDAYMCAGGLHEDASERDVRNTVLAALEIRSFILAHREEKTALGEYWFDCRMGIHTGPVIAGVVGKSKFAFDIWGPTVNIAKRMESACEPNMVNISEFTWQFVRNEFNCTSRGIITMKHKRNMQMFYVDGFKKR